MPKLIGRDARENKMCIRNKLPINNLYFLTTGIFFQLSQYIETKDPRWLKSFKGIIVKFIYDVPGEYEDDTVLNVLIRPMGWKEKCGVWMRFKAGVHVDKIGRHESIVFDEGYVMAPASMSEEYQRFGFKLEPNSNSFTIISLDINPSMSVYQSRCHSSIDAKMNQILAQY
jgi:hypothetical protein